MGLFDRKPERTTPFTESARATLAALQPLGQKATTRGVESIGKLTRKAVRVKEPGVAIVPVRALAAVLAAQADAGALAAMTLERDARGFGTLALPKESALRLVDLLLGAPLGKTAQMGALEESALSETANIALNQMVTAASELSGASFKTGVPQTSFDARARLAELCRAPAGEDHAVVVETLFEEPETKVSGRMALVFFLQGNDPT